VTGSALLEVAAVAADHGLALSRAWPRSAEHLLLDLVAPSGASVAGQWFADRKQAARVAARTGAPASRSGGVVLQPDGADRRLPALAGLLREGDARLVAHRPERRAVVRSADGTYAKVVRPEHAAQVAEATRAAAVPGLHVPRVLDVDETAGVVTTAALPGVTLHQLLADRSSQAVAAARAVGAALALLHASPLPVGAVVHDGAAELAVLHRWERLAAAHGFAGAEPLPDVLPGPGGAGPLVPVHRDLHDKQALFDGDRVGLLDFDLAAAGEAALDLANLLVHLELRGLQGIGTSELVRAAADAVLEGYAPSEAVLARLPAYDLATRRRLVAVYGFRPRHAAAARRLLA